MAVPVPAEMLSRHASMIPLAGDLPPDPALHGVGWGTTYRTVQQASFVRSA
jgi:hypothetical protein